MKQKKQSSEHYLSLIQQEKDAFQKARLINYLYKEEQLRLNHIAVKLNLHPSHISHYLRLLDLPQIVVDGYYSQHVSETHLFILSRLDNKKDMIDAYKKILADSLTIEDTQKLIREIKHSISTKDEYLSPKLIEDFKKTLKKQLKDVTVEIIQTRIKGKMVLEMKGDTEKTKKFLVNLMVRLLAQEEERKV